MKKVLPMKAAIALVLALLLSPVLANAAMVRGRVFVDANRDGVFNSGERGVANVKVSDGVQIVQTSANGLYQIETSAKSVGHIFVIVPAGYAAPDGFYHSFTGKEAKLDFALETDTRSLDENFDFIQLTDTHVFGRLGADWMPRFYEAFSNRNSRPRFVLLTGDFEDGGSLAEDPFVHEAYSSNLSLPTHFVIGNHEVRFNFGIPPRRAGSQWYHDNFGPSYYAFDYGPVHFVVVNDNYRFNYNGTVPSGEIDDAKLQQEWLHRDLDLLPKGKPVILAHHAPLKNVAWLTELYTKYNVIADFNGHWHCNTGWMQGKTQVIATGCCSGLWRGDGSDVGYRVVRYKNGEITTSYQTLVTQGDPLLTMQVKESPHLRILSPVPDAVNYAPIALRVAYNDFASERTKVFYSLDYGPWKEASLNPVEPGVIRMEYIWLSALPLTNKDGRHDLKVKVQDGTKIIAEKSVVFSTEKMPATKLWTHKLPNHSWLGMAWFGDQDEVAGSTLFYHRLSGGGLSLLHKVYITDDRTLSRLDPKTGKVQWQKDIGKNAEMMWAKGELIYGLADLPKTSVSARTVVARSAETGEIVWEKTLPEKFGNLFPAASVALVTTQHNAGALQLHALDNKDGSIRWSREMKIDPASVTTIMAGEQVAFVAMEDGSVFQVALADGNVKQVIQARHCEAFSQLLPVRDGLIWTDGSGQIACVDLASGAFRWVINSHVRIANMAVLSPNAVVVTTVDGWLYKVQIESGRIVWRTRLADFSRGSIVAGGKIFFQAGSATTMVSADDGKVLKIWAGGPMAGSIRGLEGAILNIQKSTLSLIATP